MSLYRFVEPAEDSEAFDEMHWLMDDLEMLVEYGVLRPTDLSSALPGGFDQAVDRVAHWLADHFGPWATFPDWHTDAKRLLRVALEEKPIWPR